VINGSRDVTFANSQSEGPDKGDKKKKKKKKIVALDK